MYLRLAFAVAAHVEPDIVIVDEVLAIGDARFRARCLEKMSEFGQEGRTVVFVSHDLGSITQLCRRTIWLDHGQIQADGPSEELVQRYVRGSVGDVPRADFTPVETQRVQVLAAEVADDERPSTRPPRARPAADPPRPVRRARAAPGRLRRSLRPGSARNPRPGRSVG